MSDRTISVVLVENDAIVRDWLRAVLSDAEFRVAGEAGTAEEARLLVARRLPELVIVDYRLPDGIGTQLVRELLRQREGLRALVVTANPEPGLNQEARAAGAHGTALKTGRRDELLAAVRAVAGGETPFDPRHPGKPPSAAPLSPRERDVLRAVASGATNAEIAAALGLGAETVKTLLARCCSKLGVRRRAEAVAVALRDGAL